MDTPWKDTSRRGPRLDPYTEDSAPTVGVYRLSPNQTRKASRRVWSPPTRARSSVPAATCWTRSPTPRDPAPEARCPVPHERAVPGAPRQEITRRRCRSRSRLLTSPALRTSHLRASRRSRAPWLRTADRSQADHLPDHVLDAESRAASTAARWSREGPRTTPPHAPPHTEPLRGEACRRPERLAADLVARGCNP
ncbi:hypothetical protein QJS66_15695 [Kocuria rhizophila]|nr:hypothetical protein QJS66_15695 [Kocuria rhizophila]